MGKIKKTLLSLIAAVIAVAGAWAMHSNKHASQNNSNQTEYYYHYLGNTSNLADYQTQGNWESVESPEDPGCSGTQLPCVVQSTQASLQTFVSSITQVSDVTNNTVAEKDIQ